MAVTRVLILGGSGMLGHKLCQVLGVRFETFATFRSPPPTVSGVFEHVRVLASVEGTNTASVKRAFQSARPDVVVNAIGIVKQLPEAKIPSRSIEINALLPHRVEELCRAANSRLIQVSTDCVFSGNLGNYAESDIPDATDLYGRTKLLGEVVDSPAALTLRTSIVGRELGTRHGLVEWFLSQAGGSVRGFSRVVFSGITTDSLSLLIADLIEKHPAITGLWHVSSDAISKYEFLRSLEGAFATGTEIEEDDHVRSDRSLDSSRFWAATGLRRPTWDLMIEGLRIDKTPYAHVPRRVNA
jgi:dTDP-4-dehydrorhamnose reductase